MEESHLYEVWIREDAPWPMRKQYLRFLVQAPNTEQARVAVIAWYTTEWNKTAPVIAECRHVGQFPVIFAGMSTVIASGL